MRHTGWALVALAIITIPRAAAGEDPPVLPPAPAKLLYRPAKDATFRYRFTETVRSRSNVEKQGKESTREQRSEAVWDVGMRVAEVRPDGTVLVVVTPRRVRGWYQGADSPRADFDHENPGRGAPDILGIETRVTLSPVGRVLEVAGDLPPLPGGVAPSPDAGDERRSGMERFFQELPGTVAKTGTSWESARIAAPDMIGSGIHLLGTLTERAVVRRVPQEAVTAAVTAKGGNKVAKHKSTDPVSDDPKKRPKAKVMESWDLSGEVRIRSTTGVCELRSVKAAVKQYHDLRALKNPIVFEVTTEYESKLELVEEK